MDPKGSAESHGHLFPKETNKVRQLELKNKQNKQGESQKCAQSLSSLKQVGVVQALRECIAKGENLQITGQGHPGHALIEGISKGKPLQIAGPSYSDQALIEEQSKGQVLQCIWKPRAISKVSLVGSGSLPVLGVVLFFLPFLHRINL